MRLRETTSVTAILIASALASACQPPAPAEEPRSSPAPAKVGKTDEAPLACDAYFEAKGDLATDLASLVRSCSTPRREHELAPARDGRQGQGEAVERFAFTAEKDKCYRVYAVGDADVIDIDVDVLGPDGRLLVSDATRVGHAVVPSSGDFCVRGAGAYTVELSVARGSGRYLMQVWAR